MCRVKKVFRQPAISEVDCELPGAVLIQLRDLGRRLDVPDDLEH